MCREKIASIVKDLNRIFKTMTAKNLNDTLNIHFTYIIKLGKLLDIKLHELVNYIDPRNFNIINTKYSEKALKAFVDMNKNIKSFVHAVDNEKFLEALNSDNLEATKERSKEIADFIEKNAKSLHKLLGELNSFPALKTKPNYKPLHDALVVFRVRTSHPTKIS